ncbi:MAG: hypothetical protein DRP09_16890 [Candidatus Thorarchaeota archaeon]|nr:MAG: hypothetical protein DRP09_16890 [Candidatus Thorarchaeota archaeon]
MKVSEEIRTVKQVVLEVCSKYPSALESYTKLVWYVWREMAPRKLPFIPFPVFKQLPPPETITRCFRKLVEEGRIKLPPNIQEKRRKRERAFRRYFGRPEVIH